jgi:hypothetical protein
MHVSDVVDGAHGSADSFPPTHFHGFHAFVASVASRILRPLSSSPSLPSLPSVPSLFGGTLAGLAAAGQGTISLMMAPQQDDEPLALQRKEEPRSWMPWIVASAVVVVALAALVLLGRGSRSAPQPGGAGMAEPAPYASNLPISGLNMSEASSFSGSKVTYVDGQVANTGQQTITGIIVQVGFRNDLRQLSLRSAMPLSLIRTREPYVDTEPVSADPIQPGQHREFRLIFDSIPDDWDRRYPEIRVIATQGH